MSDFEHKTLELRLLVNSGSDHPLVVETRDQTHSADLSYAIEKGHLIGEPVDLALTRDQLNWLTGKFKALQKEHYGKEYTVAPPIKPGAVVRDRTDPEYPESVSSRGKQSSQVGPVTDLMDGWMAAVGAGETTQGYDDWAMTREVTGYLLPVPVLDMLKSINTDMDHGALVQTVKQACLMVKPIWEDKA